MHVGHYGEAIAAEYFGVDPNIGGNLGSGHDFVTRTDSESKSRR